MTRLQLFCITACAAVAVLTAAESVRSLSLIFEQQPRELFTGRSPRFVTRGAQGLQMLSVRAAATGEGQDVYLESSTDGGDSFASPIRVNDVPGEVSDHGENSPVLAASPDSSFLYVVWSSKQDVRFARSAAMRPSFSPAITVNDDKLPVSHSFQTAAVGPDGTVYVAWLDGREAPPTHHGGHPAISALYLARSTDNGKTFEKNARIAGKICPCCRPSIGFLGDKVFVSWRSVETGDIRDIWIAASSDRGQTWNAPALVGRDGWKINGCPHVGPSVAALESKLYVAWFTEGSGDPAINLAFSTDGGRTFSSKQKISDGTFDPSRPQLVEGENKLALVFQGRSAARDQAWGRVGVYYREIYPDGSTSQLVRPGEGKLNANYPTVALGMSGRIFIAWTQTSSGVSTAYGVRGRSLSGKASGRE